MHDAFDRAMRVVADRVGALLGRGHQLRRVGHELPRDRIVRIGRIDQFGHRRRDRHRIARRDLLQGLARIACDEAGVRKVRHRA